MQFSTKYNFSDYEGVTINYLTVVSETEERSKTGYKQWVFRCVCGKEVLFPAARVITEHNKSCGCMRYKEIKHKQHDRSKSQRVNPNDFIGKKNNLLTVVGCVKPESGGRLKLVCSCECGGETTCYPYQFTSGDVKSCGCLVGGKKGTHDWDNNRKTHGLSKNPFYKRWNDMIRRCYLPSEPSYKHYGARGISVCPEWKNTPDAFIQWCEETYPSGKGWSLDRIDVNGDYSPENCRWITQAEQTRNLRNNRKVTIDGVEKCVTTWCSDLGISPGTVYRKVRKGMSFDEAITSSKKD